VIDPREDPYVGAIVEFDKSEGVLSLEVVAVGDGWVQYRTSWEPESMAQPRVCDPVLLKDWQQWTKKGWVIEPED
jgi:hypothetical protein